MSVSVFVAKSVILGHLEQEILSLTLNFKCHLEKL
jgi:hypothetical protein